MDVVLNEMKCSLASVKPQSKLIPSKLQTVDVDVNGVTAALERCEVPRKSEKKIKASNEFAIENTAFQSDTRTELEKIQHLINTGSEFRQKGTVNVTHVTENVFQVQMKVDARQVHFQVRCDCESNRFFGVKSEPPVDNIEKIEKLQDLEEIISMMESAFREYFKGSVIK